MADDEFMDKLRGGHLPQIFLVEYEPIEESLGEGLEGLFVILQVISKLISLFFQLFVLKFGSLY